MIQLRTAHRGAAKLRINVEGLPGSGKTMSSLLLAKGFVDDWSKIALIDTENGSGDLYEHLGAYNVITLQPNAEGFYETSSYLQAIKVCEDAGMEVIIIDSMSHEWDYVVHIHSNMPGNSFQNWGKVKSQQHVPFKKAILNSKCHVITTVRNKIETGVEETIKDNKKSIEIKKLGLKANTEDGWDYEVSLVFSIDRNSVATCTKSRTDVFKVDDARILTEEDGKLLAKWAEGAVDEEELQAAIVEIVESSSEEELRLVWVKYPKLQKNKTFIKNIKLKKDELNIG